MYSIVTELWPFEANADVKKIQNSITLGIRPPIQNVSEDPILSAIVEVIQLCWKQNPKERPTAAQIVSLLKARVNDLYEK